MKSLVAFNLIFYSFISGLFACLVSIFVKFAFNTDLIINASHSYFLKLTVQILFICISFVLNSLMWVFYSKSLHLSTNTLYSTALNKFSNFICSALFGFLVFNERLNFTYWLFGLVLLLIGILILSEEEKKVDKNAQNTKSKVS